MSARYLTTTLPYVNADPHIGFALEVVQADALARSWRLAGDEVFFSMGTDEHGQKMFEAAQKEGQETQGVLTQEPLAVDVSQVASVPPTENGGRIAIILPDGRAVIGGRIHAQTYNLAVYRGISTD